MLPIIRSHAPSIKKRAQIIGQKILKSATNIASDAMDSGLANPFKLRGSLFFKNEKSLGLITIFFLQNLKDVRVVAIFLIL